MSCWDRPASPNPGTPMARAIPVCPPPGAAPIPYNPRAMSDPAGPMNQSPRDFVQSETAEHRQRQLPPANRLRPQTLDNDVGQEPVIGPGRLPRRSIEADQLPSLILHGPPGAGRTTPANVVANASSSALVTPNAVLAGVEILRESIEAAGHGLPVGSCGPPCVWTIGGTKPDRTPRFPARKTVPPPRALVLRSSSPLSPAGGLVSCRQFRGHGGGQHRAQCGNVPGPGDPASPVGSAPDWKSCTPKHRFHAVAFEE